MKSLQDLKVLLSQDHTGGTWIAQCLEVDIAAYGSSVQAVMAAFNQVIVEHVTESLEQGHVPFENQQKAPQVFWVKFNAAMLVLRDLEADYRHEYRVEEELTGTHFVKSRMTELERVVARFLESFDDRDNVFTDPINTKTPTDEAAMRECDFEVALEDLRQVMAVE